MLYTHIQLYRCMQNHNDTIIRTWDTVLKKIYLSLYLKGLRVRGSWRPNRTATYWPPHSIGHQHFFPVLLGCSTGGLGAQLYAGFVFSTASFLHLFWSPNFQLGDPRTPSARCCFLYSISPTLWSPNSSVGGPEAPSAGAGFLYRILSPTDWISCALSYITVHAHSISLHNWPSEYALPPSLEWHVWLSSSGNNCHAVHRSLSSGASVCDCTVGF